jgi:hypothetical protein
MSEQNVYVGMDIPAPLAALTDDGKLLALRDPGDHARVDLWDDAGKRLGGMFPYGRGLPIEWLGWASDGGLLTLAGGRLTGWDWKAAKAVWEVEGGYSKPIAQPPGRAWLAAPAGAAVDLLDATTGRCLARCQAPPGADYLDLAVSLDGKALAAARPEKREGREARMFTADLWDLTTGKVASIPFGVGQFEFLHWTGPDHVWGSTGDLSVIDRRAGALVRLYGYSPRQRPRESPRKGTTIPQLLNGTPDGRVWAWFDIGARVPETGGKHVWRPQPLPETKGESDRLLFAEDHEYLRPLAGPIRVEVDVADAVRSRELGKKLADTLQGQGFSIGPKGMALRLSHSVENTTQELSFDEQGTNRQAIPAIRYTWQLITADRAVAWQATTQGLFARQGSRYFSKTKRSSFVPGAPGMTTLITEYYDFEGRDMRKAIVEEILESSVNLTLPAGAPPLLLVKSGSEYKALPLASELKLDPSP